MTALAYASPSSELPSFRAQSNAASELSYKLSEILLRVTSYARENATDWRPLTKALIEEVALECQAANWDGYGAHPVSERAKHQAQLFIDMLPYRLPAPDPIADPDGELALSWDFGPGHVFTLSIGPTGMLSYAGILGEGVRRHGMEPFKGGIPKAILESIDELCERSERSNVAG